MNMEVLNSAATRSYRKQRLEDSRLQLTHLRALRQKSARSYVIADRSWSVSFLETPVREITHLAQTTCSSASLSRMVEVFPSVRHQQLLALFKSLISQPLHYRENKLFPSLLRQLSVRLRLAFHPGFSSLD